MHDDRTGGTPWRWTRLLGLLGATLLGLGACGGGGGDPPSANLLPAGKSRSSPAPDTPPAAGTPDPTLAHYRATRIGPEGTLVEGALLGASGRVAGPYVAPSGEAGFFVVDGRGTTLVPTPGGTAPMLAGINAAGQVVGSLSTETGGSEAFSWTREGGLVRGLAQTAESSRANDVNDAGQVVGERFRDGGERLEGFLWSREDGLVTRFGETRLSSAARLADSGLVAGQAERGDARVPVVVDPGSGAARFIAVPERESDRSASISQINRAGQVAGELWPGELYTSAFFADPARSAEPVNLAELHPAGYSSRAIGLNERGEVLVRADRRTPDESARFLSFLWSPEAGRTVIRPLEGQILLARGLNRDGQVVGQGEREASRADVPAVAPVAWDRDSGSVDLNTRLLGAPGELQLRDVRAVADDGTILATAGNELYLLTPEDPGASAAPAVIRRLDIPAVVRAGTPVRLAAEFSDAASDTHTATWIRDGDPFARGTVSEGGGRGRVRDVRTFTAPGLHLLTLRITDSTGLRVEASRVVMVRGEESRVTANGSFLSAAGALRDAPGVSGRARFRLDARHDRLERASFRFSTGPLDFRSRAVELMTLNDGRAELWGTGSVGGRAGYRFKLTAIDADVPGVIEPELVRVQIWREDATFGVGMIVYDNQLDPENLLQGLRIASGQVTIR